MCQPSFLVYLHFSQVLSLKMPSHRFLVLGGLLLPSLTLFPRALSLTAVRKGVPDVVLDRAHAESVATRSELIATGPADANVSAYKWRMKVYYVNLATSVDRKACTASQLKRLSAAAAVKGITIEYERFPAVQFSECTDPASCIQERPRCFPLNKTGYVHHGLKEVLEGEERTHMVRGVLGNWCSHLWAIEAMTRETDAYDFFLIVEDDVILLPRFLDSLIDLIGTRPHHWDLIAMDTFKGSGPDKGSLPSRDRFDSSSSLPLYTLTQSMNSYWGAHAWLLSSNTVTQFYGFMRNIPAVPLDWVPKASRPLHRGFWAYQPGTILQRESATDDAVKGVGNQCSSEEGSDIEDGRVLPRLSRAPHAPVARHQAPPAAPREIVVLGFYESGTDVVVDLLEKNLDYPNWGKACKDDSKQLCGRHWKHVYPRHLPTVEKLRMEAGFEGFSEAVAVVVVRHPFSQLRSMRRRQEEVVCNGAEWGHCVYNAPTWHKFPGDREDVSPCTEEGEKVGACWANVVEAWNSYMKAYASLSKSGIFHATIILRYEDLVEAPWRAVLRVSWVASVPRISPDPASPQQARFQDDPVGFDTEGRLSHSQALEKLSSLDYGENITCEEWQGMCDRLDPELLNAHGYYGCDNVWPGFDELIFHGDTYARVHDVLHLFRDAPRPVCISDS